MRTFVKLTLLALGAFVAGACTRSDLTPALRRIPPPALLGPQPGIHYADVSGVSLAVPDGASGVRYTIDPGASPEDPSAWSEHGIPLPAFDRSTRLRAYAYGTGVNISEIIEADYRVAVAPVVASPAGGPFSAAVDVTLSNPTAGALIYYTLDGSDPTEVSALYSGPIPITAAAVLKARAFLSPRDPSPIMTESYGLGGPIRVALSYDLPKNLAGVALSLTNETALGNIAHTANVTVTLNHSLPEAGSSYRWYLNGAPLSSTAKSFTIGPAGGVVTLLPGGIYELCGELIHGSYSYTYESVFQAAIP